MKMKTLSNFFFEFIHDKSKKGLLTEYAVVFWDFENYTRAKKKKSKEKEHSISHKTFQIFFQKSKQIIFGKEEKDVIKRQNKMHDNGIASFYHMEDYEDYV